MAYLTYEAYAALGGTLAQAAFTRAAYRAQKRVDYATQGRLLGNDTAREAVKMLMRELTDLIAACAEDDKPGRVVSASNDGVSVAYAVPTDQAINARADALIRDYLAGETAAGVSLTYWGRDPRA
ncbi:MAG: hypothetical protein RSC06_04830 [Clostridia bacterium]